MPATTRRTVSSLGKPLKTASIKRKMLDIMFNQPVQEFSNNNNLDRKNQIRLDGLTPSTQRLFLELPTDEDNALMANFIIDCFNQDVALSTRQAYISNLVYLSIRALIFQSLLRSFECL